MANVGVSSIKLIDSDGDALDDGSGRLNVNAVLEASAAIDIGDVSLLLGGTAASVNNGAADATTLRVTIASDTTGVLSIDDNGGSLTIDGTVTANLSATDNAVLDIIAASVYAEDSSHTSGERGNFVLGIHNEDSDILTGANGDYSGISVDRHGYIGISDRIGVFSDLRKNEDNAHSSGDAGIMSLVVRNDAPSTLVGTNGDYSPLQVSAVGGLYVEQIVHGSLDTFTMIDVDNSPEQLSATIGVDTSCAEIFLQADEDNSGYVIVGDADVADNRGMKLNPGDSIILDIYDTRIPYLWGSAANQNVRCMILVRAT